MVNDAPALKSAHIGIAMGIAGADVAKAAADIVLLYDNFASIVNAIEEGRAVFDNNRKFITYILAHNVPELVPYLGFALFGIPLALTPIQILSIDMGTDTLTALGLGAEKAEPQIMQRPPRPQRQRMLDGPLALRAYLFLGLIEAVGAMSVFFFVLHRAGWQHGRELAATDPVVFTCDDRLSQRRCGDASRQRICLPQCGSVGVFAQTPWEPADRVGRVAGDRTDFVDRLHPLGQCDVRHGTDRYGHMVAHVPFAAALVILEELRKGWHVERRV